jgi:hypothetical protein
MLAAVLLITGVATFLYGRKIHAGNVPPGSRKDLLAKETAGLDIPLEEPEHRDVSSNWPTVSREKTP